MALEDTIETAAAKPKKVETDGLMAEAHPLPDVIAAADRIAAAEASQTPTRGLRITRLYHAGTGDSC